MKLSSELDRQLYAIYTGEHGPQGLFAATENLYRIAKERGLPVTKKAVESFLQRSYVHNVTKPIRKKRYPTRPFIVNRVGKAASIDLMVLNKEQGHGRYKYLFILVEKLSGKIFAKFMTNKTAKTTANVLRKLYQEHPEAKTERVYSDSGGEWAYLQKEFPNIEFIYTYGNNKASSAETSIAILRRKLNQLSVSRDVKDFTKLLPEALRAINSAKQMSEYGAELKQLFIEAGVVKDATEFLIFNCPPLFKMGQTVDSPEWERFLSRPSLKDVLRILAGLCQGHQPTQKSVAKDCIAIIHRLEQISTAERLGSLAENVMEALRGNADVAKKIEEVRKDTRKRKKQLAMAMREKQLEDMGMKVGAKGQVRVTAPKISESEQLQEETGLICSICREGYKYQGQKVLGIYTYTKRENAEQFELRARKTQAYCTVTHFNVVHYDCHLQAVRSARSRDEWESALLHNANTRCNGLLPLWGASVPEANFSNCLTRHHGLIQEQCGVADISIQSAVHDLKLLLLRFANNQSFSEETGGGGKESNVQLIPCLSVIVLYMLEQSNSAKDQRVLLTTFVDQPASDWVHTAYSVEGATYYASLTLLLMTRTTWNSKRLRLLKRLILTAHARHVCPEGAPSGINDMTVKAFAVYKPLVLLFILVDQIYAHIFQGIECDNDEAWPQSLMKYLRENDTKSFEACTKMLTFLEEQIYPCESFAELCDAAGLLDIIPDPDTFMASALDSAPLLDLD